MGSTLIYYKKGNREEIEVFRTIVLICSNQLKDERTVQAIFHILQGKKSIQTVQDIFLYKLDMYYHILPTLKNEEFMQTIEQLVQEGLMEQSKIYDQSYTISQQGRETLEVAQLPLIISSLNGKKHANNAGIFEKRLLLFFQVLSNQQRNHQNYIPIIDDYEIMDDVKKIYRLLTEDRNRLAQQLYKEITHVFANIEKTYATIFVDRLTGYGHVGKTMQQIAFENKMSVTDIHITWQAIIHYILDQVHTDLEYFKLLRIFKAHENLPILTASARTTRKHLFHGQSATEIATKRHLKLNTIYDHIVEIALHDATFDLSPYIDTEMTHMVLQQARDLNTYQLKSLKEALGDSYSYFQIRLALARGGTLNE